MFTVADSELLAGDEVILVVDDLADLNDMLLLFLKNHGFAAEGVGSAAALRERLRSRRQNPAFDRIALILLDIGLPDADGAALIPEVKAQCPDAAVIMLTASASLETALECLRRGADDYLVKPLKMDKLLNILRSVLAKRRLTLRNRHYRRQLERARRDIVGAHSLTIVMNGAYLRITDPGILGQAILTGITAHEGLGFNRALLFLLEEDGRALVGRRAVGPTGREEGIAIWNDMEAEQLSLDLLLNRLVAGPAPGATPLGELARRVRIDLTRRDCPLARVLEEQRILATRKDECPLPAELEAILADEFVVAPLCTSKRALGLILADNFISGRPFAAETLLALESFLTQASLALEHIKLYQNLQSKVTELEQLTRELHKNKEMLVTAGRYSALGHMAAQITHSFQNPITAIGGTARLLLRKSDDPGLHKFLRIIVAEAEKVEKSLDDLAQFTEAAQPVYQPASLAELARKAVLLHREDMDRQGIEVRFDFPEDLPDIAVDPKLIQLALVHLIANAIDAMPGGGALILAIAADDKGQRLTVRDSGGQTAHPGQNAADPFYTSKTMGTGMGLSLVRRILHDHGGRLRLRNVEGGAEAEIWLPLSR